MDSYLDIANSPIMWFVCAPVVLVVIAQALIFGKRAFRVAPSVGLTNKECWTAVRSGAIATIGPAFSMFVVMVTLMATLGGPVAWQRLSIIGTASTEMLSATLGAQAAGTELGAADYDGIAFASSCWVICLNTLGWLAFNFFFTHRMEKVKNRLERGDPKLVGIVGGAASFGGLSMLMISQVAAVDTIVALVVAAAVTLALNKVGEQRPRIRELIMAIALVAGMVAGQVGASVL